MNILVTEDVAIVDPHFPYEVVTKPTGVVLYKIEGEWYYSKEKPLDSENPHGEILCQS